MKKAIKGALFSGLIFPGLGQLMLKRYLRGFAWMTVVLFCLSVMIRQVVQQALGILNQLESTGGAIDLQAISSAAANASTGSDNLIVSACLVLLMVCWLAGTVDAYVIGNRMDREGTE
ncbi:MAG: hypothetical protein ACOZF0_22685 [Thermodesulfobacteriota bacterium]